MSLFILLARPELTKTIEGIAAIAHQCSYLNDIIRWEIQVKYQEPQDLITSLMSFLEGIFETYRNRTLPLTDQNPEACVTYQREWHVRTDTLRKHKNTVGDLPCLLALQCVTDDSIYTITCHGESLCAQRLVLKPTMIQQR